MPIPGALGERQRMVIRWCFDLNVGRAQFVAATHSLIPWSDRIAGYGRTELPRRQSSDAAGRTPEIHVHQ